MAIESPINKIFLWIFALTNLIEILKLVTSEYYGNMSKTKKNLYLNLTKKYLYTSVK